jgi:menaquinone-dependent protoporphyrinogen IX oxidase
MGKWTKETKQFLKKNAPKLKKKKTACFVSCGLVLRKNGQKKAYNNFILKVMEKHGITPMNYGTFGGLLHFTMNHGFLGNIFVNSSKKRLREIGVDIDTSYDFRNWDEIQNWTRTLAKKTLK